jgi:general transcription factor 3C protein 4
MLNLSLGVRQVILDQGNIEMFEDRTTAKQDSYVRSLTTHTYGWTNLGEGGLMACVGEYVHGRPTEEVADKVDWSTFILKSRVQRVKGRPHFFWRTWAGSFLLANL